MRRILCLVLVLTACTTVKKPLPKGAFKPNCSAPKKESITPGSVTLVFDVNSSGEAENVRITEHSPNNSWDDYAICVAKSRKYKKNDEGKAPPFMDYKLQLILKLTD